MWLSWQVKTTACSAGNVSQSELVVPKQVNKHHAKRDLHHTSHLKWYLWYRRDVHYRYAMGAYAYAHCILTFSAWSRALGKFLGRIGRLGNVVEYPALKRGEDGLF